MDFEEVALCHNSLSKHFIYIRIIILEGDRLHSFGNKQRENKEMDVRSEALLNSRQENPGVCHFSFFFSLSDCKKGHVLKAYSQSQNPFLMSKKGPYAAENWQECRDWCNKFEKCSYFSHKISRVSLCLHVDNEKSLSIIKSIFCFTENYKIMLSI